MIGVPSMAVPAVVSYAGSVAIAEGLDDLHPVGQVDMVMPLAIAAIGSLIAAIALVAVVIALSKPRRRRQEQSRRGAHMDGNALTRWHEEVDGIIRRHDEGRLPREEAFVELADVARRFASEASGMDMSARTLEDLSVLPRTTGNRHSLDMLKQTIAALYPAEFSGDGLDRHAGMVGVHEAAGWVSNLIERWR